MAPLAMVVSPRPFDVGKHRRDQRGRFSGGGPSLRQARIVDAVPSRSLTRGESWQRIGTKVAAIPSSYTGSSKRELPKGSFLSASLTAQAPSSISADDHAANVKHLVGIIKNSRQHTIERGQARGLIPEGTEPRMVHRAYNHASMLALHAYGTHDYDFRMDDHLKAEMKPLVGFMRYANRRVKDTMFATRKGGWRPYRAAFGKPFADGRKDRFSNSGAPRLRMRPNQELIKRIHPAAYAVMPDSLKHMVAPPGYATAAPGMPPSAPSHVAAVMPMAHRILLRFKGHKTHADRMAGTRHARSKLIADPRVPLMTALLGKRESRDHSGRWIMGAAASALAAVLAPRAARGAKIGHIVALAANSAVPLETRGTTTLGLASALRGWRSIPQHAADLLNRPTAVGKTPTGKELRRQFARDSLMARERFIATDRNGKVLHNVKGSAAGVAPSRAAQASLRRDVAEARIGRTYHNHPIDTAPSPADARTHAKMSAAARAAGKPSPTSLVYGFGRTANGTRARVTRYDGALAGRDPRRNLTDLDWRKARGSRYRTKAVETRA